MASNLETSVNTSGYIEDIEDSNLENVEEESASESKTETPENESQDKIESNIENSPSNGE